MSEGVPKQLGPRASFRSLPIEITTLIAGHCDKPTTLSLARVSRVCASSVEARLLRDISAKLNPHYGELPYVQPYSEDEWGDYAKWASAEARRVEDEHGIGVKQRISTILFRMNKMRAGMVQELSIVSLPGAVDETIELLEAVAPSLRRLTIDAPFDSDSPPRPRLPLERTIDAHISGSSLSFPALTYLHIGQGAFHYAETFLFLLTRAPNLIELHADIDHELYPLPRKTPTQPFLLRPETQGRLERAEISCNGGKVGRMHHRLDGIDNPTHELLMRTSSLRQLYVQYRGAGSSTGLRKLLAIAGQREVRDLHLVLPRGFGHGCLKGVFWMSLTTLVLRADYLADILSIPTLEVLVYLMAYRAPQADEATGTLPVQSMSRPFASHLRFCPNLRIIHTCQSATDTNGLRAFDQLPRMEHEAKTTGFVRSYSSGDSELLHARLLSEWTEYDDIVDDGEFRHGAGSLYYKGPGGVDRVKQFRKEAVAVLQDFTDLDGRAVPLDAIEAMWAAEGVSAQEWEKRGVQVSDAAWSVLMDWSLAHGSAAETSETCEEAEEVELQLEPE